MIYEVKNQSAIPLVGCSLNVSVTGAQINIGTILPSVNDVTEDGWLLCDGSTYDINQYPFLYELLGTDKLPDYRNYNLVGAGTRATALGNRDVYAVGETKSESIASHSHSVSPTTSSIYNTSSNTPSYWNSGSSSGPYSTNFTRYVSISTSSSSSSYYSGSSTTHPKRYGVNFYIYGGA